MKTTSPFNLIHIHVEKMPTPAIADSVASLSLISLKFYQRFLARQDRSKPFKTRARTKSLYAANDSKMAVKTAVDFSVDIQCSGFFRRYQRPVLQRHPRRRFFA
jgi:hypothetical protein